MTATILYIEDNVLNMRLVRKLTQSFGYNMLEALDAKTGLVLIQQQHPDLILLDVNLPDMDGLSVSKILKSDARFAHIPIIAVTANAMHGDRERCLAAGCSGYVPKPISRQELFNAIQLFLAENPNGREAATA